MLKSSVAPMTSMKNEQLAESMWMHERNLIGQTAAIYAGVDEVGRGCIAGPVYAAAVVLGGEPKDWVGIKDSKKLSKKRREALFDVIVEKSVAFAVGVATVAEVDALNILQASRVAMGRAIEGLHIGIDITLVDGIYGPIPERHPLVTVIDGDALCVSIAAASILAKVERDRYMEQVSLKYPEYGFEQNAGYGTKTHIQALHAFGPTPLHRRSFAPVKNTEQMMLGIE